MAQARTFAGLDVHVAKIEGFALDLSSGECHRRSLPGSGPETLRWLQSLPVPLRTTYEAGPTGFGLARALEREGIECVVAAPGSIPRSNEDRVKTDRRDAEKLCRLLAAGQLKAVDVPSTAHEGLRDLLRAREDVRRELMSARHRAGKILSRHGHRWGGPGSNWTVRHREWCDRIELDEPGSQAALADYLGAIDALVARREGLERRLGVLIPGSEWEAQIARLRCLRGIDTLTAAGLCAELGDLGRFGRAGQLMSFVGLVPDEHSSGEKVRRGSITKTGSTHARRLLVEAGWHYRRHPARGKALRDRQDGASAETIAISWRCQQRLHRSWRRLEGRGKRRTVVAVAVARELAGFCWAVARS